MIFIYFLCLTILQSLKSILSVDPEIQDWIAFNYDQAKSTHLAQRRTFWERFLDKCDFYLVVVPRDTI